MAVSKLELLNHFKAIREGLEKIGATASVDVETFVLEIKKGNHIHKWHPQFLSFPKGENQYSLQFTPDAVWFIGWRPYMSKRWPFSDDKLKFKEYLLKNGLPTPEYSTDKGANLENVLVKRGVSSFSAAIRGPFRSSRDYELNPVKGEYYERFIEGKIVKAWFWNTTPICMELMEFPYLLGKADKSIKELVEMRIRNKGVVDAGSRNTHFDQIQEFLEYQGRSLDSKPAVDEKVDLDFRYGSLLTLANNIKDVNFSKGGMRELESQLVKAGAIFWAGIPADVRDNTVYAVDAILDNDKKLWFLEMNSNPFVHPDVYPYMVETVFADFPVKEVSNLH